MTAGDNGGDTLTSSFAYYLYLQEVLVGCAFYGQTVLYLQDTAGRFIYFPVRYGGEVWVELNGSRSSRNSRFGEPPLSRKQWQVRGVDLVGCVKKRGGTQRRGRQGGQ